MLTIRAQTYFNENPAADNFGKVKDQLAEVKDVMVENIGAWALRDGGERGQCCLFFVET